MKKQTKNRKVGNPSGKRATAEARLDGQKRLMAVQVKTAVPGKKSRQMQHGPRRERVQISVRISKAYMDLAYAHIKETNTRITDLIERGLVLAMAEERKMPPLTKEVRFYVANTTTEEQRALWDCLVWLAIAEVRPLSKGEEFARSVYFDAGALARQLDGRERALEHYHRYGRASVDMLAGLPAAPPPGA